MAPSTPPTYRETLAVPWSWWLVGVTFAASLFLIALRFLHPGVAVVVGLVAMLPIGLGLLVYGGTVVRVTGDGLHVGRGVLEWPWVAGATALDADGSRDRMGPGADARAWLCVRPYLHRVVEVQLDDPADPHPYWLVGTRHPERLAAAIAVQLRASGQPQGRRVEPIDPTGVATEE